MSARASRLFPWKRAACVVASVFLVAPHTQSQERSSARWELSPTANDDEAGDPFPLELHVAVGDQKVLSAELVESYSEGKRGIVDVRLTRDAKRFVVVGLHPGVTSLLFLLTDGTEKLVRITVRDPLGKGEDAKRRANTRGAGEALVERRDNVQLDFYFVQLEKGYDHRLGLGTPDSVAAGLQGTVDLTRGAIQGATAMVEDQALLRLDLAQAAGWAKLMRQATVITQNGAKARFSGGGEVNVAVQGSLTTGIHRISFGSSIEVLPRYDAATGRIEVELRADVSDLSDDRGSGAPGRTVAELETVVNLRLGQAVVLGGLTASSATHVRSGLPWMSQIPVLGLLFGAERVTRRDTENVVFIVPTVMDSVDDEARAYIREALETYRRYDGDRDDLEGFGGRREAIERRATTPSAGLTPAQERPVKRTMATGSSLEGGR